MPQTIERRRQYYLERRERALPHMKKVSARWRDANRDLLKDRNRHRRLAKRAMCLVAAARVRARRKSVSFELVDSDITRIQEIIDKGFCQLSGVAFTLEGPRSATSPSLDRIDSRLGYVPGNVRVICYALNAALGNWGEGEFRRIAEAWLAQAPH